MLLAVVDIGSNTTRLLIAECRQGALEPVLQQRHFTRIGEAMAGGDLIPPAKVREVAELVASQVRLALDHGVSSPLVLATAAVRDAANASDLVAAVEGSATPVPVRVLGPEEEAELAFKGATATFPGALGGLVGVVDVGGGSTEIALGRPGGGVAWSASRPIGSSAVSQEMLGGDPPGSEELEHARHLVAAALAGAGLEDRERPGTVLAVGGSATSVRRLAGAVIDERALEEALRLLSRLPAAEVADRYDLDPLRVRLMPAGLLIFEAIARLWRLPLQIANGGIREGALLDLAARR